MAISWPRPINQVDNQAGHTAEHNLVNEHLNYLNGRSILGAGSPEGAVTAAYGTVYTDTAVTTGALRWIKTTDTGSAGWRVLYGDTGLRDISTLLAPDWALADTLPMMQIQRINREVSIIGRLKRVTTSGARSALTTVIATLPAGFRPSAYVPQGTAQSTQAGIGAVGAFGTGIDLSLTSFTAAGNWATGDEVKFQAKFATRSPSDWPTTLPGTAV